MHWTFESCAGCLKILISIINIKNIDYNPGKIQKILIVFDDMIVNMITNKNLIQ